MEALNDVPTSPMQNVNNTECTSTPEHQNLSDDLPTINTDDLPITPLKSKRWLDSSIESSDAANLSINSTSSSLKSQEELHSISLPNTDDLLDIAVPKTALLGKEQAKKRLHAFSVTKSNLSFSPIKKKNMKRIRSTQSISEDAGSESGEKGEKTDEKYVLKKPFKKNVHPNEKAKAVIEEIEEIKKIENAYFEALEQGLLETKSKKSRSRSRSRERSYHRNKVEHKRSRSIDVSNSKQRKKWERIKYPASWNEIKSKGYDLQMLAEMKSKEYKDEGCKDFRRQFLFQTRSFPLNRLIVKCGNGKEKEVLPEFIRFTRKKPSISYSIKESVSNDCYLRETILQYVPKSFRENIKKIINNPTISTSDVESSPRITSRKWFPRVALNKLENSPECKVLENSLGLSFLQNYSDEEEQDKEVAKKEHSEPSVNLISEKILDKDNSKKLKGNKPKSDGKRQSKVDADLEKEKESTMKKGRTKKHKKKEKKQHKLKLKKSKKHKKKKTKTDRKATSKNDNKDKSDKESLKNIENKKSEHSKAKNEVSNDSDTLKNKSSSSDNKKNEVKDLNKCDKSKIQDKKRNNCKDNTYKDERKETELESSKLDSARKESRKSKSPAKKCSSKHSKVEEKLQTTEQKPKLQKNESPSKEQEVRKVKCVAEKEFGTPDTEEYYSNWESDVDLTSSFIKDPPFNQSSSLNQSWLSEDEQHEASDIPLVKSPSRNDSPSFISDHINREDRWMHKRNTSRRPSLQDNLLSPIRDCLPELLRPRHIDNFTLNISTELNELSPIGRNLSSGEFSPFANRCLDERRRPIRSFAPSRSPLPETFSEMPLNIRNIGNTYSRLNWDEESFSSNNNYNRSSSPLFGSNTWERDDYITIKAEEMRLEEERRTLIEERRKLEIERRQLEELEKQRYYSRMNEYNDDRRHFDDRKQESFNLSDDEINRYRIPRDFREKRDLKENEMFSPRRLPKDQQQSHRRSLESREKIHGSFNWEDIENKRVDKFQEQVVTKRKRKSRWQDIDGSESQLLEQPTVVYKNEFDLNKISEVKSSSKDKKSTQKNKWESSEDEIIHKTEDSASKENKRIQSKYENLRKFKDTKHKTIIDISKEQQKCKYDIKQKSITDNLDISAYKSFHKQHPEELEDEYEKFMQALGSEISTAEEISEKSFKQKKQKSRLSEKRVANRKSYSHRSVSESSDEELTKTTKKQIKKRKTKKKSSSSSSSSSTSSSWSDSDSSSYSSSTSSSSDVSSSDEKYKKRKRKKTEINRSKMENKKQKKLVSSNSSNTTNFDLNSTKKDEMIKVEETTPKAELAATPIELKNTTPESASLNKAKNLNIINLSSPEFSLHEIPLPNVNILKSLSTEVPLPVPSPRIPPVPLGIHTDSIISKIEPVSPLQLATPIAPVPPVTSVSITTSVELIDTFSNTIIKEEPIIFDEDKSLESPTDEYKLLENLTDVNNTISPMKRNLVPIKFLTAELKKQTGESLNLKTSEPKEESMLNSTNDIQPNTTPSKSEGETLPLTNHKRHFAMSTIVLTPKGSLFNECEVHDDNSTDFTDKFMKKNDKLENVEEVSTSDNLSIHEQSLKSKSSDKPIEQRSRKRSRSVSPRRRDSFRRISRSPYSQQNRITSPRRKEWEDRHRNQRMEREKSPRRLNRRKTPPRRYREDSYDRSISPRRRNERRDYRSISPRERRPLRYHSRSPRRSRELSPRRYRNKDRLSSKESKIEPIQEALQRIAGVDLKPSPISSPLHGFKRSVADSTISDDQLIQSNREEQLESPGYNSEYFKNVSLESPSPKRMSLDERINQALGLSRQQQQQQQRQQPNPISTIYSGSCDYDSQYFDQYGQYYEQYEDKRNAYNTTNGYNMQNRHKENSNVKVLQVGNVLQVVPTEDLTQQKPSPSTTAPVQQNKVTNSTQKIVQVGNMLQIVPTAEFPSVTPPTPTPAAKIIPAKPTTPVSSSPIPSTSAEDILNAEALIKQKNERHAEKIKRKQERDRKRKEKEKKQKEREKRKQLKAKLQTEAMIKQALIKETEEDNPEVDNVQLNMQWPPIPQIVFNSSYKPAGKGILCPSGSDYTTKNEDSEIKRKSVKFSDGIVPGEGTSPSGGEELSSPPPAPKKLPKEKRYIKTKIPKKVKKKKVKVKVIRQQQTQDDDDDIENDRLPPPPPPPGSPPPHIFPARIKQPIINNIHPNVIVSIANPPPIQPTDTSYPPPSIYRTQPQQPPVMMPHHGPPHLPPQGHHHHHPPPNLHHPPPQCPPPPPPQHGGFNLPPMIIQPVVSIPSFGPPKPQHHHHGRHHHHHHGENHHHHHGGHYHRHHGH